MKRIEDIKEFKDIDTYYEISKIVEEVFQDRVEAHKHLVTANKEIERLNNIIDKAIEYLKENACIDEDVEYFCDDLRYDDCKKLLEILKGE